MPLGKTLSRGEQRGRTSARLMVSIGLEAHLRNLATDALAGDQDAVREFQEFVQYAPPEMKARVLEFLEGKLWDSWEKSGQTREKFG